MIFVNDFHDHHVALSFDSQTVLPSLRTSTLTAPCLLRFLSFPVRNSWNTLRRSSTQPLRYVPVIVAQRFQTCSEGNIARIFTQVSSASVSSTAYAVVPAPSVRMITIVRVPSS